MKREKMRFRNKSLMNNPEQIVYLFGNENIIKTLHLMPERRKKREEFIDFNFAEMDRFKGKMPNSAENQNSFSIKKFGNDQKLKISH